MIMKKLYKVFLGVFLLAGCTANDTQKANCLLDEARHALESNSFDEARNLIDSLRNTYPQEFDVRRTALKFMDSLELKQAKVDFLVSDSILTFKQFELDDLKRSFTLEKQEKYQTLGYYVTNDYAGSKTSYDYFTEVEENGTLLAVSINRAAGNKYDFTPIEIDLSSDIIPACPISRPLTEKEQSSYEKCYQLAKAIQQMNKAKEAKEKFDLKVRFFEKKIKEQ